MENYITNTGKISFVVLGILLSIYVFTALISLNVSGVSLELNELLYPMVTSFIVFILNIKV